MSTRRLMGSIHFKRHALRTTPFDCLPLLLGQGGLNARRRHLVMGRSDSRQIMYSFGLSRVSRAKYLPPFLAPCRRVMRGCKSMHSRLSDLTCSVTQYGSHARCRCSKLVLSAVGNPRSDWRFPARGRRHQKDFRQRSESGMAFLSRRGRMG